MQGISILDLNQEELGELLASLGEPTYRAGQIYGWLYRSLSTHFSQMTNLPKTLREELIQRAYICTLKPLEERVSSLGLTRKVLFELKDSETIESVLMLYHRRQTVCISTQVGCAIGCPFCATGQTGFTRNLSAGEILEQVLYFARLLREGGGHLTNVVFMGMGEPLANYDATWQAIERLNDPDGFGLGSRQITLSTVGLIPGIERLSRERITIRLAISLHSPENSLRDELVPINKKYPLEELMRGCRDYIERTGRRLTFEYVLIDGINDSPWHARKLGHLLQGFPCHVNLIPLNSTPDTAFRPSPRKKALAFQAELSRSNIPYTFRLGRGLDIQAGCGQLRSKPRRPKGGLKAQLTLGEDPKYNEGS